MPKHALVAMSVAAVQAALGDLSPGNTSPQKRKVIDVRIITAYAASLNKCGEGCQIKLSLF